MTGVLVDELADVRTGDKGDTLILAVVARTPEAFGVLQARLTAEVIAQHYRCARPVTRSVLPQLSAMVFRLPGLLNGGVTGFTGLDGHGKTLGYHLLRLRVEHPPPVTL